MKRTEAMEIKGEQLKGLVVAFNYDGDNDIHIHNLENYTPYTVEKEKQNASIVLNSLLEIWDDLVESEFNFSIYNLKTKEYILIND